jgi:hypothetical protein
MSENIHGLDSIKILPRSLMAKHISPVAGGTVASQRTANSTRVNRQKFNEDRILEIFRSCEAQRGNEKKKMGYFDRAK